MRQERPTARASNTIGITAKDPMRLDRSVLIVLLALLSLAAPLVAAQVGGSKRLQGHVFGNGDQPLPGAMVYLKNSRTKTISVNTAEKDGAYHFPQVPQHITFEVWAEYNGAKSPSKTLSEFDVRNEVTANLHIDVDAKK